jgi:hypothetical protein
VNPARRADAELEEHRQRHDEDQGCEHHEEGRAVAGIGDCQVSAAGFAAFPELEKASEHWPLAAVRAATAETSGKG